MAEYIKNNLGSDVQIFNKASIDTEKTFRKFVSTGYTVSLGAAISQFNGYIKKHTNSDGSEHFSYDGPNVTSMKLFENTCITVYAILASNRNVQAPHYGVAEVLIQCSPWTAVSYAQAMATYRWSGRNHIPGPTSHVVAENIMLVTEGTTGKYAWAYWSPYTNDISILGTLHADPCFGTITTTIPTVPAKPADPFTPNPSGEDDAKWAMKVESGQIGGPSGTGDFAQGLPPPSGAIPLPQLPTVSAASSGLINMYKMSVNTLNALADYLWSPLWSVDTFKKIMANPMDCILGLSMVPDIPGSGGTGAVGTIHTGNIDTGISAPSMGQYASKEMGSAGVGEYYGSFLDYAPYTSLSIYLPFIGTRELNVDDFMGGTLGVTYYFDMLAGQCVACITGKTGGVVASYSGACAVGLPVTSNNWGDLIQGALRIAASAVGGGVAGAAAGGVVGAVGGAATGLLTSTVSNVMGMKPSFQRGNSIGGSAGFLAVSTCYLIRSSPILCNPDGFGRHYGYATALGTTLANVHGFTVVFSVHLDFYAPASILTEIEQLLKSGVIF